MKRSILALSMVALLGLSACAANGGTWTPQADGRTAGKGQVERVKTTHKANSAFNSALHK